MLMVNVTYYVRAKTRSWSKSDVSNTCSDIICGPCDFVEVTIIYQ